MQTTTHIDLKSAFTQVRAATEKICKPLEIEDYVVQPISDVSPPKWHLGHTTWFFETFLLIPHVAGYEPYDHEFNFVFNSYYESIGSRVIRTDRGNLSRPTVNSIYKYRKYVDVVMSHFLERSDLTQEVIDLVILGLNHEQQHQELLFTDIKYILGHNPLFPEYRKDIDYSIPSKKTENFILVIPEGNYEVGYNGNSFSWDNELGRHKIYLNSYAICSNLVSNAEYLEFILNGGYQDFRYWHAEGWDWVKKNHILAPLYWHTINGQWHNFTFRGMLPIDPDEPVCHVSYFEAYAYANWKGMRLPTEFEWEVAAADFNWGHRWEWTASAYVPYPGYRQAPGALGEYNGKFMVNQQVLRGASEVTSINHSRITYRNFFQTNVRWQFAGIRLAK
ncbi:ergothioneine biosynthesis protein EgtB [Mucilaginibacter sp. E4BP6]|uniref:ergothioneine biosynthesis protein EgtB n=1 Tax=Mucilaginibacter sp. E4BP6 TaxID=2723089 RepID=UPI0015CA2F26|nr:ergothioneine biosynthesis protein EgtB [Mucilaginibacter sp. E4BP6]NYE67032.1 ergothioneine biosynthesis protein EgtB [Mucilaginibacter sp. E4BP6]